MILEKAPVTALAKLGLLKRVMPLIEYQRSTNENTLRDDSMMVDNNGDILTYF